MPFGGLSAPEESAEQLPGPMNIRLPHLPVSNVPCIACARQTDTLKPLGLHIRNPDFRDAL